MVAEAEAIRGRPEAEVAVAATRPEAITIGAGARFLKVAVSSHGLDPISGDRALFLTHDHNLT
jgi:hypothetical protein